MKKILWTALLLAVMLSTASALCLSVMAEDGAEVIPLGESINGTIGAAEERDWYTVQTGNEVAYYTFTLEKQSGNGWAYLYLYNERDEEMMNVYEVSTGSSKQNNVRLEPNSSYRFQVLFNQSHTGNYAVKVSRQVDDVVDELEIEVGREYKQSIDGSGDRDWYTITTGDKVAYYFFDLKKESGNGWAYLYLYNDRDTEIMNVYEVATGSSKQSNVRLEPHSTYRFQILFNQSNTGNYTFKVTSQVDDVPDTLEIEPDQTYDMSIDGSGDVDWYEIKTGDRDAYYFFDLKKISGNGWAYLYLYDDRDAEMMRVYEVATGSSKQNNVCLEAGRTYRFQIIFNNPHMGNYTFRVHKVEDDVGNGKDTAQEFEVNRIFGSTIDGSGDWDYFVIHHGEVKREYRFEVQNNGNNWFYFAITSERDEKLLEQNVEAGRRQESSVWLEANTTYYVACTSNNGGTGAFSLKLSQCFDGHTASDAWKTVKEPTCFTDGERCRFCKICGEAVETEVIDALGHDFSGDEVVKEATLIIPGQKKATCPRCGEVEYSKDWSKVWILPTVIVVVIAVVIGVINYARAFKKK